MYIKTPYYLIHESKLLKNLKKIQIIKENTGAKFLLALKCFSTWSTFNFIKPYLDGVTCGSLYETLLANDKFGKEIQTYSIAYSKNEFQQIKLISNKIIFNSISQLKQFDILGISAGLRINPTISYSPYDLADPARKYSKLGVSCYKDIENIIDLLDGLMFHFNCDNEDIDYYIVMLNYIVSLYGNLFKKIKWISLGGGFCFTNDNIDLEKFYEKIKEIKSKFNIEIYFEPGEAVVSNTTELVTSVIDIIKNEKNIAIVDASVEAHMLDLMTFNLSAKINSFGQIKYIVAGKSCLAGDIFGEFLFNKELRVGDEIRFIDAGGYTMVKKNWFNGLKMPSIVIKRLNGDIDIVKIFTYDDFKNSLS